MDPPNSQNDLDARFTFLLQPIKDLAKNFDIDLGSHLEDYMAEIAKITIRFSDGNTTLNFAEAALIIQGSASVYSQKVEYLYRLAFGVLDMLGNKKSQQQNQQQQQTVDDAEQTNNSNAEDPFMSLDDINEGNNTLMKNDKRDGPNSNDIAPLRPSVLLRLDDADRAERPLVSRSGEALGSLNDFQMNTSSLHAAGAMLFDLSNLPFFDPIACSSAKATRTVHFQENGTLAASMHFDAPTACDDAGVDEGCPPDFDDSDNCEAAVNGQPSADKRPNDAVTPRRYECRSRDSRKQTKLQARDNLQDIWTLLDPHKVSSKGSEKKFRKGKVFSIPERVSSAPNKKRKHAGLPDASIPALPFCQLWNMSYFSRMQTKPASLAKGCTFPDFESLIWAMAKRRKELMLQKKTNRNAFAVQEHEEEDGPLIRKDDDNDDGGDVGGGDDDDGDVFGGPLNIEFPDAPLADLLEDGCNQLRGETRDVNSDFPDVNITSSYEELVQRYVEGFMNSAKLYIQDTALARRVAEWEQKIVPRLQEEERRRPFDIHEYGSEVIERIDVLGGSAKPVSFNEVVEKKPAFEICRYLLATLQLANFGNVEIGYMGDKDLGLDNATCKLLSRRRHFEELTDYRVPSLKHGEGGL